MKRYLLVCILSLAAVWAQAGVRPRDVSRTIDSVAADPRFAAFLALDKVGMYGMSAGGHTALTSSSSASTCSPRIDLA